MPNGLAEDLWKDVREAHIQGDVAKSLELLLSMDESKMTPSELSLKDFALGLLHFQNQQYDKAKQWFQHHVKKKGTLRGYAQYYLGEIMLKRQQWEAAKNRFNAAISERVPRNYIYKSRFYLGQISFQQKHYRSARRHFRYAERKWRSSIDHPKAVYNVMLTEFAQKSRRRACYWARRMYYRYPTYAPVQGWSNDLFNAEYKPGVKTKCNVSFSDRSRRIRRLQWEGLAEKALQEIQTMDIDKLGLSHFFKDRLLAEYYVNQGYASKSLEILMKYREEEKGNYDYNLLLAKAAQRVGNYYLAQNTYRRAMRYTRSSRKKRKAQFKSAFLAYQNQDYDLAAQMFEQLTSRHRRSRLYRDSKWYLAWTKYMRGDSKGALSELKYIARKQKRSWRWRSTVDVEKVQYWTAMAERNLGQFDESYYTLKKLTESKSEGFYSTLSRFRMQQVYQLAKESGKPIELSEKEKRNIASKVNETFVPGAVLPEVPDGFGEQGADKKASASDEEDDADYNENLKVVLDEEPSDFYHSLFKDDIEEDSEEGEFVTYFKDPRLSSRFDRVRDLVRIGYNEAARWELYEIERRTRNETYQKSLMGVYKEIAAYNRSAYVSQVYFGSQRKKYGIEGVRYLWEHAYPRPYQDKVQKVGEEFQVPAEFIYSIMRAESFFKPTIESPVGAKGLMQIMPNTGRQVAQLIGESDFQVEKLLTPEVNIRLGGKYLQRLLKMFGGQIPLAAAGYNAGPHRVENWLHQFGQLEMDEFIEHIPYKETRNYVKKVTRHYALYNKLYANNEVASVFLVQPIKPVLNGRSPIRREHWDKL